MFSVIKHYKFWFVFSGFLTAGALVLLFSWGLKPGIDFRGGTLSDIEFENPAPATAIQEKLNEAGINNPIIQPISDKKYIVKTEPLSDEELASFRETLQKIGSYKEHSFESIGPTIGRELVRKAYWQIILVCLGIILYIAYSFRNIPSDTKNSRISSWRMGASAILALLHDLSITVGLFAVLGHYYGVDIDSLFITALLTILGFSVHDTIVVFDRIRENLKTYPYKSLGTIIDYSINSTLARSINTSSTLIFVLIAMLLFGGQSIYYFVLTLLVGVAVGTYSSIFIASPILYVWSRGGKKK